MPIDSVLASLNAGTVQQLIPHREPFLFVQSAKVLNETKIQGVSRWSASHPILQGHFQNQPVVPGVCQIEACAQLAGVLIAWNAQTVTPHAFAQQPRMLGVLGAIRHAKFHNLLLPSTALNLTCQLRAMSPTLYLISASGHVDNEEVMRCEFVIGLRQTIPLNSKLIAD